MVITPVPKKLVFLDSSIPRKSCVDITVMVAHWAYKTSAWDHLDSLVIPVHWPRPTPLTHQKVCLVPKALGAPLFFSFLSSGSESLILWWKMKLLRVHADWPSAHSSSQCLIHSSSGLVSSRCLDALSEALLASELCLIWSFHAFSVNIPSSYLKLLTNLLTLKHKYFQERNFCITWDLFLPF